MNERNLIRLLKADEIECRVSTINEKGLSLLLYKDARVDQKILDETFGIFGWKRSHQSIEGNLYCTVEILDKESGMWVAKQDVGTTGYAEKEKSQASDSFKRACFNWGIGRELYTAPFIWIPAGRAVIEKREKRCYCNDSFAVASIDYNDNREIRALTIVNDKGEPVYELGTRADRMTAGRTKAGGENVDKGKEGRKKVQKKMTDKTQENPDTLTREQMNLLQAELARTGVTMDTVQSRYQIQEPGIMGEELYGRVMSALKRTRSVEAA